VAVREADCSVEWQFSGYTQSGTGSWDLLSFANDAHGRSLVMAGTADPDNSVYALDALTGALAWTVPGVPQAGQPDIDFAAGVTVSPPGHNGSADGVAYIPDESGYMLAIDLTTGSLIRSTYFAAGLPNYHTVRSTPTLAGNGLVFGEADGVMRVNAQTGARVWAYSTGDIESLSSGMVMGPANQQVVPMTTVAGQLIVLSYATGALLYQYQLPSFSVSSVADVDGNLLVTSAGGYLYDFTPGGATGATPTTAVTSPATGQVLANQGTVTVMGTASGSSLKSVDVSVQSGGASGPWWNAATGTWTPNFYANSVVVSSPGASTSAWSLSLPVPPTAGTYRVLAAAVQGNGLTDTSDLSSAPGASVSSFSVGAAAGTPVLSVSPSTWIGRGASAQVSGTGFAPGEGVALSFAGTPLASATADGTGALPATVVTIPTTAPYGSGVITATGQASARVGTIGVQVANNWSQSGHDSMNTNIDYFDNELMNYVAEGPPSFLNRAWSYPAGSPVRSSPAIARDIAYVADDAGTVTALDVHNSNPLWTVNLAVPVDSSPAVVGAQLFLGTEGNGAVAPSVTALGTARGTTLWTTRTTSAVESSPSVSGSTVYVGSDDGTVYALSTATGSVIWSTQLGGAVKGTPAVDPVAGLVIVGDATGRISALASATGQAVWSYLTGGPVTASVSVWNGIAYVGSADGSAYALSESTGTAVWITATPGPITGTGVVYAPFAGRIAYVVGSTVGSTGAVSELSLTDGSLLAGKTFDGPVIGLGAAQGWLTATLSDGELIGMKRNTEEIWKTQSPAPFVAAPVVVDGVVYAAGTDQMVTAWTIPGVAIP
jgi:outer membrane protein assembly factor BamB